MKYFLPKFLTCLTDQFMAPIKLLIPVSTFLLFTGACWADAPNLEDVRKFYSAVPTATMDDPRRNEWQMPEKVVAQLLIKKGDVVADVGAGTGYFTMLLAEQTGKSGMVYAVDVDKNMTEHLTGRIKNEPAGNVKVILSTIDNPMLPTASADLIFLCDTYIFIENRGQYLTRLRDSLKNNGRLAIISYNMKSEIPGAPPPRKRVPREQIIQEVQKAGYLLEAEYFFLPYQYFMVFAKNNGS